MIQFDKQVVVGVVFDLSTKHHPKGRHIDIVKASLVEFSTKLGLNCGVYVAHPDQHKMPHQQGESVAGIFSYKEPLNFRASDGLLQATEMIAAQEADEKYVVFITDRYRSTYKNQYQRSLTLNKSNKYGCKFIFFGVGEECDSESLKEFADQNCEVYHCDDPQLVGSKLQEVVIVGV